MPWETKKLSGVHALRANYSCTVKNTCFCIFLPNVVELYSLIETFTIDAGLPMYLVTPETPAQLLENPRLFISLYRVVGRKRDPGKVSLAALRSHHLDVFLCPAPTGTHNGGEKSLP